MHPFVQQPNVRSTGCRPGGTGSRGSRGRPPRCLRRRRVSCGRAPPCSTAPTRRRTWPRSARRRGTRGPAAAASGRGRSRRRAARARRPPAGTRRTRPPAPAGSGSAAPGPTSLRAVGARVYSTGLMGRWSGFAELTLPCVLVWHLLRIVRCASLQMPFFHGRQRLSDPAARQKQLGALGGLCAPDSSSREVFCVPSPVVYWAVSFLGGAPHTLARPPLSRNTWAHNSRSEQQCAAWHTHVRHLGPRNPSRLLGLKGSSSLIVSAKGGI